MLNPVGVELENLYHWQNPKFIRKFGVLNGMHSHASVRPVMKYCQAPSSSTVNQASHKSQAGVWITDVELVISKLASKAARNVWFQVADVSTPIHQVRRPDTHQPLEHSAAQ